MTRGRKVLEIRPQVAWDKGKALLHLLEALGLHEAEDVVPVYIGDDRTDEDAFMVLRGCGVGILVSTVAKPTAAQYTLSDPDMVRWHLLHSVASLPLCCLCVCSAYVTSGQLCACLLRVFLFVFS
jgi:trehalose-phosphatase